MATLAQLLIRLQAKIAGLESGLAMAALRVELTAGADDTGGRSTANAATLAGQDVEAAEVFQPYGLSSVPPAGSTGVAVALGGDPAHLAVLGAAPRSGRPTGRQGGEVSLYSDAGQRLDLLADGSVLITPAPGQRVDIGAPAGPGVGRVGDEVTLTAATVTAINAIATQAGASPLTPETSKGTITTGSGTTFSG